MRDDKLIDAMARAMWDQRWKDLQSSPIREFMGASTREWECKEPDVQEAFRQQARAALAALQETHAVVPREFEAAMASSGPSGHSVEVQFKDRKGALEFYASLKGLGSDWVQRQLDYIAARKKAAPQTEEADRG